MEIRLSIGTAGRRYRRFGGNYRHLIFSRVLRLEDFADAGECVDLSDGFVWTQAQDTRKAEGKAAVVAVGALNVVEGHLENDGGFDITLKTAVFGGVLQKILGQLANLDIGEARVGFADIEQPAVVTDGKCVIGQEAAALAMTVFGDGDDDIERGERTFELHPKLAAAAGHVGRLGCLGEEAFVAGVECEEEAIFDFVDRAADLSAGELKSGLLGLGEKAREKEAALGEGRVEQSAAVKEEQIEGDKAHGNLRAGEKIDLFTAEALLKLGEWDRVGVAPSDDFAVKDEIAGDVADRFEQLGEFRDAVECAGVDLDLQTALMNLGTDAVELVFDQRAVWEGCNEVGRSFRRAGEHYGDGAKELEIDGRELVGDGEAEDVGDVSDKHIRALDGRESLIEGFGDGFFDETFFQADAQLTGGDFDEILGFQGGEALESVLEESLLGGWAALLREGCVDFRDLRNAERRSHRVPA